MHVYINMYCHICVLFNFYKDSKIIYILFIKVLNLRREEQKALKECKKLAKEGRVGAAKMLAKEVVNTRRTIDRMQVCCMHACCVHVYLFVIS